MIEIILAIIVIYVIIVFILSRLVIPHLKFVDEKLPMKIPEDMEKRIDGLKNIANSPWEFLELVYEFIGSKYRSERFNTLLKISYLFKSLDEIWNMSGYIPCSQSNFLIKIFLTRSSFFKEEDIKRKHAFVNFVPHQYLQVKLDGKWIDVDVGEKQEGMPIGKHLKYFG